MQYYVLFRLLNLKNQIFFKQNSDVLKFNLTFIDTILLKKN